MTIIHDQDWVAIGALCVLIPGIITAGIFAARESGKNHRKQDH